MLVEGRLLEMTEGGREEKPIVKTCPCALSIVGLKFAKIFLPSGD